MKKMSMAEMLSAAEKNNCAIAAINASNLETISAVLAAASHCSAPVILQFSPLQHAAEDISYREVTQLAELISLRYEHGAYVVHQDHGESFEDCLNALEGGFTSIMYDGAALSYEENIANSARVRAVGKDFFLESELGVLGAECSEQTGEIDDTAYTRPELVKEFVERTGCDSLAVSIGNAHGIYKREPKLRLDILDEIHAVCPVPLVLHGASGIPYDHIRLAISKGIRKINFFTQLDTAFMSAFRTEADKGAYMMFAQGAGFKAMTEKCEELIQLCTGGKIKC